MASPRPPDARYASGPALQLRRVGAVEKTWLCSSLFFPPAAAAAAALCRLAPRHCWCWRRISQVGGDRARAAKRSQRALRRGRGGGGTRRYHGPLVWVLVQGSDPWRQPRPPRAASSQSAPAPATNDPRTRGSPVIQIIRSVWRENFYFIGQSWCAAHKLRSHAFCVYLYVVHALLRIQLLTCATGLAIFRSTTSVTRPFEAAVVHDASGVHVRRAGSWCAGRFDATLLILPLPAPCTFTGSRSSPLRIPNGRVRALFASAPRPSPPCTRDRRLTPHPACVPSCLRRPSDGRR